MKLKRIKIKREKIYHTLSWDYDYYTKEKKPYYIVELTEDEYLYLLNKDKKYPAN
jgi:hypothetical protein